MRFVADALDRSGVVLAGAPGVGKTRLAREALAAVAERGLEARWAVASASASCIPLGAMAHLLPNGSVPEATDRLDLLRAAAAAVVSTEGNGRVVLGVDDAHLLDDVSAALVHHLALTAEVGLVVTLSSGEPPPDAIMALWKDGLLEQVEVTPLTRTDVDALTSGVLGGVLESHTFEQLWSITEGNVLYLQHLVEGGLASRNLMERAGVWQWRGEVIPGPRLIELIESRLVELGADERRLLELLALGEPLDVDLVRDLGHPDTLASVERHGVVLVELTGTCVKARLAHPLYGRVLRSRMSALRAYELRRILTRGLSTRPVSTPHDVLRLAILRLESADVSLADAALIANAAQVAIDMSDFALAERLARPVSEVERGSVFPGILLAHALLWQGRGDEAAVVLARLADVADTDFERALVAVYRVASLFFSLDRADEARVVISDAEARIREPIVRASVTALGAALDFLTGRPRDAITAARRVLAVAEGNDFAVAWAAAAGLLGCAVAGNFDEIDGLIAVGRVALERRPAPDLAMLVAVGEVTALRLAGRLYEAEARAVEYHGATLGGPVWVGTAAGAMLRGQVALARGRLDAAARWLREAIAGLVPYDPAAWTHWCHIDLLQALAMRGDVHGAARALGYMHASRRSSINAFAPDELMAEAWATAVGGETTRALELAQRAAEVAVARGQTAVAVTALHTAVRFGGGADLADRIAPLAVEGGGQLAPLYAAHASACHAKDGFRLSRVSRDFEALGVDLLAGEAAAHAAVAYDHAGRRGSAHAAAMRAAALAQTCEGARTPALELAARSLPLTRREREVVTLAAGGLSNKAIAQRLFVSVRTAEGHLERSFAKLGIHDRRDLAGLLDLSESSDPC